MGFLSLRVALIAIIVLAIAPALLLTLRTHAEQSNLVQQYAHQEARRLVQLAALDQDRILAGTREFLTALAELPVVRNGDWDECTALFGALFSRYEGYTNIGVADRTGDVRCAAWPNPQRVNITDRAYFQRAIARRAFAVGEYQIGRTTRQPNLAAGYPVLDERGEVQAVVWASRDLSWLNRHVDASELPPDSTVLLLDSAGTVLARYPNPQEWVGRAPDVALIRTIITQRDGTVVLPGLDGRERLHAFVPLEATDGTAFAAVGLSQETVTAVVNRLLLRNLLALFGVALLALLLAGIGGELLLMRRVRRLVHAADRLRAGDLSVRAGGSPVRDELAHLATAFDAMTASLQERTEHLSRTNAQLQQELTERARHAEERAHLINELEARSAQLEARVRELALLHDISQLVLQTSDIDAFLQASLDRIMPIGAYDLGVIRLLDASGLQVEHVAARGYLDPANVPGFRMSSSDPAERVPNFRTLRFERAQGIADLAATDGFRSYKREGIVSLVSVPIRTAEGILGFFNVGSRTPRTFAEAEVRLLDALGVQLGVAAQKARLYDERRRSEEQLRQAQKMEAVGVLAGGIAHDFNNLLTAITGFGELLLADPAPAARRVYVEEIVKAGQRASALTSQLLAFSRQQVLRPEVVDLNQVVADMDRLLRRVIGEDIDVVTIRDSDLGTIWADPGQIAQVVLNLAANARDAMPTGGTLTIETANVELDDSSSPAFDGLRPGPYVQLTVRDSGHGMDAATRARIFEPFFTTKGQGKGTGLGLATVYGIVKQSGGDIRVTSEPGDGTAFTVCLPRHDEPARAPAALGPPALPRGSETILLVEDEEGVRRLSRDVLVAAGYTVLEAALGSEALQVSTAHPGPIHLLVTDVVMPGMSGRELAELLTAQRPATQVLYMSGYTPDVAIRHGVEEAGVAYLQKPFAPAALVQKVRELLDDARLLVS